MDDARSNLDWLTQEYPDVTITEAANMLINSWNQQSSIELVCEPIALQLNKTENPNPPFLNLGLGNPKILMGDVCPTVSKEN